MSTIEVKVPDIGDFKDVPVIEVFVKPGDAVKAEDSLVTLESDKATMDVPAPAAGTVKELKVKVGDKVSEGSLILTLESAAAEVPAARAAPALPAATVAPAAVPAAALTTPRPAPPHVAAAQGAATYAGAADIECEMLVLGAGPGGYSAAFRSADLGMKTVLVERYRDARRRVSECRLHSVEGAAAYRGRHGRGQSLAEHGVAYGPPQINLDGLRGWKNKVVGKLTGGLTGMARARKVEVVRGVGAVPRPASRPGRVDRRPGRDKTGGKKVVRFAEGDHRGGVAVGLAAVHARRPARGRFDRRTGACDGAQAPAGRRRRASSASKWAPSIRRSAPASTWWKCSTA